MSCGNLEWSKQYVGVCTRPSQECTNAPTIGANRGIKYLYQQPLLCNVCSHTRVSHQFSCHLNCDDCKVCEFQVFNCATQCTEDFASFCFWMKPPTTPAMKIIIPGVAIPYECVRFASTLINRYRCLMDARDH